MSNLELLPRYTYRDYLLWEGDWELIEGIAVSMAPAPMKIHQQIQRELFFAFNKEQLDECDTCELLSEVDWKLSNDTVVRPDMVFICNDESEKYLTKAPKIIIEILSPSTAKKDETVKFNIYEEQKVEYYILIYPNDLVARVYKIREDRYSKIGDFSNEILEFSDIECELSLDFKELFYKFKK
jgi:Uma2 family endonuclease